MTVLFKLQIQFYTKESNLQISYGLDSCYHLVDFFFSLFVGHYFLCEKFCCILNFFVFSFLHLFEKKKCNLYCLQQQKLKWSSMNLKTDTNPAYDFILVFNHTFSFFSLSVLSLYCLMNIYGVFWMVQVQCYLQPSCYKNLRKSANPISMKVNWTFHVGKTILLTVLQPVLTFQCTLTKHAEVLLRWVGLSVWWHQAIRSFTPASGTF